MKVAEVKDLEILTLNDAQEILRELYPAMLFDIEDELMCDEAQVNFLLAINAINNAQMYVKLAMIAEDKKETDDSSV
jgi:hypothetical protein